MLKSFKLKYFHFGSLEVLHIKVFLLQELKKNLDGLQSVDLVAFIAKIILEWKKNTGLLAELTFFLSHSELIMDKKTYSAPLW